MEFVVMRDFVGDLADEMVLDLVVVRLPVDPAMPLQNPSRIGVDDERFQVSCIKENRVSRFRANSIDAKQFLAKRCHIVREHPFQVAIVLRHDVVNQVP